jgi:outer membrane autotransporter protein
MNKHHYLALAGLLLSPWVQAANECGDPSANGSAADSFSCDGGSTSGTWNLTATGMTHTADGDLTLQIGRGVNLGAQSILTTATGADGLNLSVNGTVTGAQTPAGAAAVDLSSEAGAIILSADRVWASSSNPPGTAIRAHSASGGDISVAVSGAVGSSGGSGSAYAIDTHTAGHTHLRLSGVTLGKTRTLSLNGGGTALVEIFKPDGPLPDPRRLEDYATLIGNLDFQGLSQTTLRVGHAGAWVFGRNSLFGDGDDVVEVLPGARMLNQAGGVFQGSIEGAGFIGTPIDQADDPHIEIHFGDGNDRVHLQGVLQVGTFFYSNSLIGAPPQQTDIEALPATLTLLGLDRFEHGGDILLGTLLNFATSFQEGTLKIDGWNDDVLAMPGTHFVGAPGSRILFDVNFNGFGQEACDGALRADDGRLPVADCVDLRGGSTEGQTELVIATDIFRGDFGAYSPEGIVLIDVEGGDSAAEHFRLSPESVGYRAEVGAIEKGIFLFALGYDEGRQQHRLYGVPGQDLHQLPLLAHVAQDLWRETGAGAFQRQASLRENLLDGRGDSGGSWARMSGGRADRSLNQEVTAGSTLLAFDNGYSQDNTALSLGVDGVVEGMAGGDWVFGGMVGYGSADLDFDRRANVGNFEGPAAGIYGGYQRGDAFIDAMIYGNWMSFDFDVPVLNLFPDSAILLSDVQTLGARAEAGWRWQRDRWIVEPLAGLSYATSRFDDIEIPARDEESTGSAVAKFDDAVSFRGILGVRLAAEKVGAAQLPLSLSLTTRIINEFDGEARVAVANTGPIDAPVVEALEGQFIEAVGGVSISNASGTAEGYLNLDGVFADDYDRFGWSLGFRYRW